MDLDKNDYIVGVAVTPKEGKKKTNGNGKSKTKAQPEPPWQETQKPSQPDPQRDRAGLWQRTPVEEYRLQSRGGKGVINVKTTARNGNVVGILLVDETSEAMLISQFGKIIRIDTKTIREAGGQPGCPLAQH